jgi:hypothetical protein
VDREYDIFEKFPDGFPVWRGFASGLVNASLKLAQIAKQTTNECFMVCLPSKEIVARLNVPAGELREKRVVCQVSYDFKLGTERAALLRANGYEVISIYGNDAARVVLSATEQHCVSFIVGHGAPAETRRDMVRWLKEQFPKIPVIAMNAPGIGPLDGVDYNVKLDGPETWLPIIASASGESTTP